MASPPVYLKTSDIVPKFLTPLPKCSPEMILDMTWGDDSRRNAEPHRNERGEYLQSSFDDQDCTNMRPERHGLMGTVLMAYYQHHHLVLRPDDVWIAILTQFSFYVNAHAEDLRSKFVAHEGNETLHVEVNSFTFEEIAMVMAGAIHSNVVDKNLAKWILPDFSTTTTNDTIVSAALMMALLKQYASRSVCGGYSTQLMTLAYTNASYFVYEASETCGIPSITLEGTKQDWEKILRRIDKLEEFGHETTAWAALLRPHPHAILCGGPYISGWIATFSVWSNKGEWIGPRLPPKGRPEQYAIWATRGWDGKAYGAGEVKSAYLHIGMISVGFCDVELTLKYPKPKGDVKCTIVAENVALDVKGYTVRPIPGWFMFVQAGEEGSTINSLRADLDKAKKRSEKLNDKERKEERKFRNRKGNSSAPKKGDPERDSVVGRGRGLSKFTTLRSIVNVVFCRSW